MANTRAHDPFSHHGEPADPETEPANDTDTGTGQGGEPEPEPELELELEPELEEVDDAVELSPDEKLVAALAELDQVKGA